MKPLTESELIALINSGLSLIPITEGKKNPHWILGKTYDLLERCATSEEIKKWMKVGVKSWGVAGGAVSGNLVCLDFDEKHYFGLYDLWYARLSDDQKAIIGTCAISITRNKGHHVRYRTATSQPTEKLSWRVINGKIETTSETKAEGGYALIPPSSGYTLVQGDLEHFPFVADDTHEEFIDIMRTFNEVEIEPATEYERKPGDTVVGDRPGDRLNAFMSWPELLEPHGWVEETKNHWRRPGKKDGEGISATTDHAGVPILYVFSTAAVPFTENKGYTKFRVFAMLNHGGDYKVAARAAAEMYPQGQTQYGSRNDSQASGLLKSILSRKDVVLFHDELGDGYISLDIDGHQETLSCKSKALRKWLSKEIYRTEKTAPSSEALKSVLAVLEGNACYGGSERKLNNRMAWHDGALWYDLTNKEWRSIKINENGWEIFNETPTIFRRYSHHRSQVTPVIDGGDASRILEYINVSDEKQKLLLLVYLVSCFIPEFPHALLIIFGSQGSAKSTLSRLLRWIIDPSAIEVASMPDNQKELIQTLAHHAFLFFDNVSFISEATSDTLCKAVTGGGFPKRELYSDDDDIIYNFMRCVGINGINLVATRPDLLERSLLIELERIDSRDRKQEKEIMSDFQRDLPIILGGVFDVLAKAIRIHPTVKVDSLPRMADFATWGCAIAEALGFTQEEFMDAYRINIDKQTEALLNENVVAAVMISFMASRDEWIGTASQLLHDLTNHAAFDERVDTYEKYWPKASNILMRRLNELKVTLRDAGIIFTSTPGDTREITLRKIKKITNKGGTDGTDDVSVEIGTRT